MSACTFFGHKNSLECIKKELKDTIEHLILNDSVKTFYVGNNGSFDLYVYKVLKELKKSYANIELFVVLAYVPENKDCTRYYSDSDSIYPDNLDKTPLRYHIDKRNRWMIDHSDFVITHVLHTFGGAYKYASLAKAKKKQSSTFCEFKKFLLDKTFKFTY